MARLRSLLPQRPRAAPICLLFLGSLALLGLQLRKASRPCDQLTIASLNLSLGLAWPNASDFILLLDPGQDPSKADVCAAAALLEEHPELEGAALGPSAGPCKISRKDSFTLEMSGEREDLGSGWALCDAHGPPALFRSGFLEKRRGAMEDLLGSTFLFLAWEARGRVAGRTGSAAPHCLGLPLPFDVHFRRLPVYLGYPSSRSPDASASEGSWRRLAAPGAGAGGKGA